MLGSSKPSSRGASSRSLLWLEEPCSNDELCVYVCAPILSCDHQDDTELNMPRLQGVFVRHVSLPGF